MTEKRTDAPGERQPFPISVTFEAKLRTDGELLFMCIEQDGDVIRLTRNQAESLVNQISVRLIKERL